MKEAEAFTPLGRIAQSLGRGETGDHSHAHALAAGLDAYTERMTTPASAALQALENATRKEDWGRRHEDDATSLPLQQTMLSGNLEGQFLTALIAFGQARSVLEIGMFTGYGALAMAQALPRDGRLVALEIDPFVADFAQSHFDTSPDGHKIDVIVGSAAESLNQLASDGARFDLVFIDADKPGYIDYYDAILERDLLANNGLICVDNTLLGGEVYTDQPRSANGEAIAAFNEYVRTDDRTVQVLLPVRDGVTLIRRAAREGGGA